MIQTFATFLCLFIIAVAFSAIGHGGASGYTAVLLLFGYEAENIRPVVLCMNIVVTAWVLFNLRQHSPINYRLFIPLILASTPAAFLGGAMSIHTTAYRVVIGILLLAAALRLLITFKNQAENIPHILGVLFTGALLGWLSGLTGIGGGVLLSPLLLILGWSSMQNSIPIVAGFILINSISGLIGYWQYHTLSSSISWPLFIGTLTIAFAGAVAGSFWSKLSAKPAMLKRLLAIILMIAGLKMLYTALI